MQEVTERIRWIKMAGKGEQLNEAELPQAEGREEIRTAHGGVCGETGALCPVIGTENGTAALET